MSVVKLVQETEASECAKLLRRYADMADRGEVVAVHGVAIHGNGTYEAFGTMATSCHQRAGMLLEAAIHEVAAEGRDA